MSSVSISAEAYPRWFRNLLGIVLVLVFGLAGTVFGHILSYWFSGRLMFAVSYPMAMVFSPALLLVQMMFWSKREPDETVGQQIVRQWIFAAAALLVFAFYLSSDHVRSLLG